MSTGTDDSLIVLTTLAGLAGMLSAYGVRVARTGHIVSSRLDTVHGTLLLGRYPIEAFHWVARGVGRELSRTGVSPDTLTLVSLWITAATAPLAATGRFEAAGIVLLVGSAFDALDGIVARERKMASNAGGMLDSVFDRYADAFCLLGLSLFYRASGWKLSIVFTALVGSMMVSYVRAKAEALGLSLAGGLMRRPERIAYLAGGLLLGPAVWRSMAPADASQPATLVVVALIAVASNAAALNLLRDASRSTLRRRSEHGERANVQNMTGTLDALAVKSSTAVEKGGRTWLSR